MKISHKLNIGFLGTSLLLGITGLLYLRINLAIERDTQSVIQSTLVEVKASKQLARSLQSLEASSQQVLLARSQRELKGKNLVKNHQNYQIIEQALIDLDKALSMSQKATSLGAEFQDKVSTLDYQAEKEELSWLKTLKKEINLSKQLVTHYLALNQSHPDRAEQFFSQQLQPQIREVLIPLVQKYQDDAIKELEEQALDIKEAIHHDNQIIVYSLIVSIFLSLVLGRLVSRSIAGPIEVLQQSALRIGQGKFEPISTAIVQSQDELGVLAVSFNQMLAGLKKTTVSKSELDRVLSSMIDSLIVITTEGTIEKVNQATVNLLGYSEKELINKNLKSLLAENTQLDINNLLQKDLMNNWEITYLTKDGRKILVAVSNSVVFDEHGDPEKIICVARDITERRLAERKLRYEARHDKLTGLPNRTFFKERLEQLIQRTQESQDYLFAVLFLDLDRFKVVNDSLGHLAGDELLIELAQRLKRCFRSEDLVARLGGDEFAILLENLQNHDEATTIAQRVQEQLNFPFHLAGGHELFITASIGIALNREDYKNIEDFLRDADTAMYKAKALGKARHVVFDRSMHIKALERLNLENDLRRAIERNQFQVFYQPIVELDNREIIGFEALVRWQHPQRGMVSPAEFIPIAEETGAIVPIGWWVLRTACRQMRQWKRRHRRDSPLTLSVNLSALQFAIPDLSAQIMQILEETGLEPHCLTLEITESAIIENIDRASLILQELKAFGIKVSMDDFGTGYSSLSYLYRLPISTLKIDRSFVRDIESDRQKLEVTRTIVLLANNLGMDVIAEGVETSYQLALLSQLNCEYGQGYLFSKPVPSEIAEALIVEKQVIL